MLLTILANLVQIGGGTPPIPPIPDTGGGGGGSGIPFQDSEWKRRRKKRIEDEWMLFIKIFTEQCQR